MCKHYVGAVLQGECVTSIHSIYTFSMNKKKKSFFRNDVAQVSKKKKVKGSSEKKPETEKKPEAKEEKSDI